MLFAIARDGDGDEHAVGTVALKHEGDGVYELTKMAVAEECRGAGIGRLLMDGALDAFRALDGRELFLESSTKLAPGAGAVRKRRLPPPPRAAPGLALRARRRLHGLGSRA